MKSTVFSLLICLSFIFIPNSNAFAQEEPTETETENSRYKHGIGLAAGTTSGYGLSYRYFIKRFGFQLTFSPYRTYSENYNYEETNTVINTGLTFLFYIDENPITNLFLYQSNFYHFQKEEIKFSSQPPPPNGQTEYSKDKSYWNNGLGIGLELIAGRKVSFNIMTGFGFYNNFKEINFAIETGIYYIL